MGTEWVRRSGTEMEVRWGWTSLGWWLGSGRACVWALKLGRGLASELARRLVKW